MSTLKEKLSRLLWGSQPGPAEHIVTRWAFIRALGIVYLIAFVSVWVQADGLFGDQGILPVQDFLDGVRQNNPSNYYQRCPTVFWFGCSNTAIHLVCAAGTVASVLMAAVVLPGLGAILAWICYLSLVKVGQDFFGFQWDELLLEAGFLAIFFAPARLFVTLSRDDKPSRIVLWLLRWLCFRLMFSSGLVKLTSGDPTWTWPNFTAMTYHYFTQPLPVWTAWYMHQLPVWFQKFTTIFVLAIELIVPFTIFAPRRVRHLGAYILVGFQVLLILTGNYCFFNLLAIVLCIPLFDDAAFPARFRNAVPPPPAAPPPARRSVLSHWRTALMALLACAIVPLSILATLEDMGVLDRENMLAKWPKVQGAFMTASWDFNCVGGYGLFRWMTTKRPEIAIEGSNDGENWLAYEFKYKPGDMSRRPAFVAPYQPRLDWQMWFAVLYPRRSFNWFLPFIKRLLDGSPAVLSLLEKNPFPDAPPKYIRAVLYEYTFTDRANGDSAWWQRKQLGLYMKDISLDDFYYGPKLDDEKQ